MPEKFDPRAHLSKVGGADYLTVKWRQFWFREEHPDGAIETELIHFDMEWAVCRSRVSIPGGGIASDYGSETARDFKDYIEKACTKATGRALASLGFGTQFVPDEEPLADSPIARVDSSPQQRPARTTAAPAPSPADRISASDLKEIWELATAAKFTEAQVRTRVDELFGVAVEAMTTEQGERIYSMMLKKVEGK
jgi:hypothetical protein